MFALGRELQPRHGKIDHSFILDIPTASHLPIHGGRSIELWLLVV
jgi:hypothetical protein